MKIQQVKSIKSRDKILDSLRGVAILGVVLIHSKNFAIMGMAELSVPEVQFLSDLSDFGMYGVELFFLISGYLISKLYPRDNHSKKGDTKRFFQKRILRIWPLWIVFSTTGFLIGILGFENGLYNPWGFVFSDYESNLTPVHHPVVALVVTLLFLGFITPLLWVVVPGGWSIQNEMANYILYAFLRGQSLRVVLFTLLVLGVAQTVSYVVQLNPYHPLEVLGRLNAFSSACFFFFGVALQNFFTQTSKPKPFVSELNGRLNLALLTTVLLLLISNPLTFGNTFGAMGFISTALLVCLVLNRLGIDGPLVTLGRLSYFVYYFHFVALYLFAEEIWGYAKVALGLPPLAFQAVLTFSFVGLCFVSSVPLAALSWRFIEKPLISLGQGPR